VYKKSIKFFLEIFRILRPIVRRQMSIVAGAKEVKNETDFYSNAKDYWNGVCPNLDGMMGGLPQLSPLDLKESKPFLEKIIQKYQIETGKVCDIGAGIGRVTQHLFLPVFKQVFGAKPLFKGSSVQNFTI